MSTEIRVTVETREAKYTELYNLTRDDHRLVADIETVVGDTIHGILNPRGPGLTQLETPVGFVDAELSEQEFRFLQNYRAAAQTVGGQIDEEAYDVRVAVVPRGLVAVQTSEMRETLGEDLWPGRQVRVTEPHPEIGLTADEGEEPRQFNGNQFPAPGIATPGTLPPVENWNQFPGTVADRSVFDGQPREDD